MLRTNLSTRPFYNVRAVKTTLAVAAAIIVAVTAYNIGTIGRLVLAQRTLGSHAADAERQAEQLRAEAAQARSRINPRELNVVTAAAREANGIIDRRAFSWSELFSQFEATLPSDVRITSVRPRLERDGTFVVTIGVESRRVADLDSFINALETRSTFRNVLAVEELTNEEDLIEATLEGVYVPREAQ